MTPIKRRWIIALLSILLSSSCSTKKIKDGPPLRPIDVSRIPNAVPLYEPKSRYGNPHSYVIARHRYYVLPTAKHYKARGMASWYGRQFQGRLTSNHEVYDMLAMTAASPVLPIPSYVRVTNLENHRSVIVRVNDRGPFAADRIIDLSYVAAKKLAYIKKGTALVEVETINPHQPQPALPGVNQYSQLYLQAGVFSHYLNAIHLKQRLSHYTHKQIRIRRKQAVHKTLYQVQIGPLATINESDALFKKLHRYGLDNAITIIQSIRFVDHD